MELNGLRNIVQNTGPMVQTASSLSNVLREEWFKKNLEIQVEAGSSFTNASDMEIQGSLNDFRHLLQRQVRFEPNPFSYTDRAARQRELMQRLAIAQKKKPSYRQRQKNGRAGRKK